MKLLLFFEKSSLQSINTLLATSWLEKNISLINAVKEQPDNDEEGKFFVVLMFESICIIKGNCLKNLFCFNGKMSKKIQNILEFSIGIFCVVFKNALVFGIM